MTDLRFIGDWRLWGGVAVGLVLAGGGARGLAHLGVMKALAEQGIEPDVIGGTSIGAIMAALLLLLAAALVHLVSLL